MKWKERKGKENRDKCTSERKNGMRGKGDATINRKRENKRKNRKWELRKMGSGNRKKEGKQR